tara:strand:- start:4540 stop:5697 length:1158 start_codon:yes stop_codon:yes gene_type:complete
MDKIKNLTYLTYQTFPADTANSIQSINLIKNMVREGLDVRLVFPQRSKNSNDKLQVLKTSYEFEDNFKIKMLKHNYPFKDYEKNTLFKGLRFNISHFLWSRYAVKNTLENERGDEYYITRSDWIFYFLSRKNKKVLFECHQVSKIRKFVIKNIQNRKNSKIVFTTRSLRDSFSLNKEFIKQTTFLHNGYDDDYFINTSSNKNKVIFVGNFIRFNKDRNINFLLESFKDPRLKDFSLTLVGGPEKYKNTLQKTVEEKKINNVSILGRLSRRETIHEICSSGIGLLINSDSNLHSTHHTSPLKYFEYLRAGLKIVAVDFFSHRSLPEADKIIYFSNNDKKSFIDAVIHAGSKNIDQINNIEIFSSNYRAKNIIEFFARPEGFEPPTL